MVDSDFYLYGWKGSWCILRNSAQTIFWSSATQLSPEFEVTTFILRFYFLLLYFDWSSRSKLAIPPPVVKLIGSKTHNKDSQERL